jgi:hypothetical protein
MRQGMTVDGKIAYMHGGVGWGGGGGDFSDFHLQVSEASDGT